MGGGPEGGLVKDHTFPEIFFLNPSLSSLSFVIYFQLNKCCVENVSITSYWDVFGVIMSFGDIRLRI